MNQVDRLRGVEDSKPADDAREQKRASAGKAEASRQGKISQPVRWNSRVSRAWLCAVHRLDSEDRVMNSGFRKLLKRLGDKATCGIVLIRWIEGRER